MKAPLKRLAVCLLLPAWAGAVENRSWDLLPDEGRALLRSEIYDRRIYANLEDLLPGSEHAWCLQNAQPPLLRQEPAVQKKAQATVPEQIILSTKTGTGWEVVVDSAAIPPLRFEVGKSSITDEYVRQVHEALERVEKLPGIRNIKLKVTGHTDSSPITGKLKLTIADNWVLSRSRAERVGALLQKKLADQLSKDMIVAEGKADTEPLASNATPEGKAFNRRVEVEVTYEKPVDSIVNVPAPRLPVPPPQLTEPAPASEQPAEDAPCGTSPVYASDLGYRLSVDGAVLEGSGRTEVEAQRCQDFRLQQAGITVQADAHEQGKVLSLAAWPDPAWRGQPIAFTAYWNYSRWIDRAEVRLFPAGHSAKGKPFAVLPLDAQGRADWTPAGPEGLPGLRLVLRVYDAKGRFDETEPYDMRVSSEAAAPLTGSPPERERNAGYAKNHLRLSRIPVKGSAVTVAGTSVKPGHKVFALGREVPLSPDGRFAVQEILPEGRHDVAVRIEGPEPLEFLRPVYIAGDKWFYVALADLTAGANGSRGPAALVTADPHHYSNKVFADGRLAFYLKGLVKGDWLLTASADTREQPLSSIFSNLGEKDPRYLLRRLDPDQYYPVYGDDSAMLEDAPTQGKFYVRLERGDSSILWGNYTVSLHGGELASVDRSLYGGRLRAVSGAATKYGERRSALEAFVGDPGTLSAREEFRGTGGSLYYIRHLDATAASDLVTIETRDKNSGLVLRRQDLVRGQDYDIDYLQGRLVLSQPLPSTSDDSLIVRGGVLSGNPVFLVVRYEYQPGLARINEFDLGGRVSKWFGDNLEIGVNASRQKNVAGGNSSVEGMDATLRYTPATYLKGELAQSLGSGAGEQRSVDGGFSFNAIARDPARGAAAAARLEGAVQLSDLKGGWPGRATGYWKNRESGFSAPGQLTLKETEQSGGAFSSPLPGKMRADLKYDKVLELGGQRVETTDVSLSKSLGEHWSAALAGHIDSRSNVAASSSAILSENGDRTDLALQLGYDSLAAWSLYGFGQGELSRSAGRLDNASYGLGGRWAPVSRWALTGEGSANQSRYGGKLGSEVRFNDRSTFYTNYQLETQRSDTNIAGRTGQLVTGVRSRYSDSTSLFGEERWQHGTGPTGLTHAYGLDVAETDGWHWGLTAERGTLSDSAAGDFRRTAATGAMGLTRKDVNWSSALEFREESGAATRQTWLTRNSFGTRLAPDWRLITKLSYSWSRSGNGSYYAGAYTEGVVGFAYRPTYNDRLNALFKYTYFRDVASPGQLTVTSVTPDYRQRSHVLSADATYELIAPLSIGAKYATRLSKVQVGRAGGSPWLSSNAHLGILRLDWHVVRHWDLAAEGRQLRVVQARDVRTGALLGVYRHLGANVKLGAGYNFTDFSDDLTDLSYTSHGWFINLLAKF